MLFIIQCNRSCTAAVDKQVPSISWTSQPAQLSHADSGCAAAHRRVQKLARS